MWRKSAKSVAILAALLAISIGLVGKFKPTLFLTHAPHYGYILWAMTGNPLPPHFDPKAWNEEHFHKFIQPGDIIQSTTAKSGSLWLQQIVHLIKHNGTDNLEYILDGMGVLDIMKYPGQTIDDRIATESRKRRPGVPMSWFTHEPPNHYGLNPKLHPDIKYIVTARNGKEVLKSFHPFMNGLSKEFKDRWGGFAPPMPKESAVEMFALKLPNYILGHIRSWWPYRKEHNVLLLHYANLKSNPRHEISRIANFLNITVAADVMEQILEQSSFSYMKRNSHRCAFTLGKEGDKYLAFNEGTHINSGKADGGEEFFTPSMNAIWERAVSKHWNGADPEMISWVQNGGPLS